MKAIQIVAPRKAAVVDVPTPEVGEGQVLVRLIASSICNQMEWKAFTAKGVAEVPEHKIPYPLPPGAPGHEGVGEVVEVGEGVEGLKVGDIVVMTGGRTGLHAEYAVRDERAVVRLERDVPPEPAAPLELYACVLGGIRKAGGAIGQKVVVSGLGPAGLAAVQLFRATGAAEIIGIDPVEERRERAVICGADAAYSPDDEEVERLKREGVPLVFDTSGAPPSILAAFEMSRDRVMLFGVTWERFEVDESLWYRHDLTIMAVKPLGREGMANVGAVVRLYERGRIEPEKIITHRMRLEDYARAMELVGEKKALKILLVRG
jgi:2-desacetyl-2-hydroxyethyl bacteriochlorophyllide A dehydrogenase